MISSVYFLLFYHYPFEWVKIYYPAVQHLLFQISTCQIKTILSNIAFNFHVWRFLNILWSLLKLELRFSCHPYSIQLSLSLTSFYEILPGQQPDFFTGSQSLIQSSCQRYDLRVSLWRMKLSAGGRVEQWTAWTRKGKHQNSDDLRKSRLRFSLLLLPF